MRHSFEYMHITTAMDSIEVEDIGSCCLHAFNDGGYEFWLLSKTSLGITKIVIFGFVLTSSSDISNIELSFNTINYEEKKIIKFIEKWLSSSKRMITQVFESSEEEFKNRLLELDLVRAINSI